MSVEKIAALANLHLSPEEIAKTEKKFSSLMAHFDKISQIETEGVEPLFHFADAMELRADVPEDALPREDLLRNAPDQLDGSFRLPKVLGGAE